MSLPAAQRVPNALPRVFAQRPTQRKRNTRGLSVSSVCCCRSVASCSMRPFCLSSSRSWRNLQQRTLTGTVARAAVVCWPPLALPRYMSSTTKLPPHTKTHETSSCPSSVNASFSSSSSSSAIASSSHKINRINTSATARTYLVSRHFSSSSSAPSRSQSSSPPTMSSYSVRKVGQPNTTEFRAYMEKDGVPISPFHDIPLYANEQKTVLNMIVEIPRWTNAKQEVRKFLFFSFELAAAMPERKERRAVQC